ncbi:MAG: aminotransferase class V-fold PLP-dependent enzyme, partial [Oceanobacter sp.]
MTALDLTFVRQQFPAFAEPSLQGTAFFENAGGSYLCKQVLERLERYFREMKVQPYYPNRVSGKAGEWMDESYQALANWMDVSADQVYFGPSTSQNSYVLAQAMDDWLQPGDEIIVTNQDHEANTGVWRKLEKRGLVIREWSMDEQGKLNIPDLNNLMSEKTRLLCFPHCSNILGDINPVSDICSIARSAGVRTVVDGVSFAGHGLPNVAELGCDIYLYSLYKVYGPHQGVMVIRPDMTELLSNQGHFFNAAIREKRYTPAGPDHAQVAAARGVSDYFEEIYAHHFPEQVSASAAEKAQAVRSLLHESEIPQIQTLLDFFREHPAIKLIGPDSLTNRAPTLAIQATGHNPWDMAEKLGEKGVLCGGSHFYSWRLLE